MKKQILLSTLLFIVCVLSAYCQGTETNYDIELRLFSEGKKHSYALENVSYYFSANYNTDSIFTEKSDVIVGLNCNLSDKLDKFLLQWMAQTPKYVNGEVVVTDVFTGEEKRKLEFKQALVSSQNESFMKGSNYGYGADLILSFKELTIDGVAITK